MNIFSVQFLIVVITIMLSACRSNNLGAQAPLAPTITRAAGLQQQIEDLVQDKHCDSTRQCRSLPFGARACGGPAKYLIYSAKNTHVEKLHQMAAQYLQLAKLDNKDRGVVSICTMLEEPFVACINNRCQGNNNHRTELQ